MPKHPRDETVSTEDPNETILVKPSVVNGEVAVPGSKSISNRVLLLAALGRGECKVRGLLHSDDTRVMLIALQKMGVEYSWDEKKEVLTIVGSGGKLKLPDSELYMKNAGTATRFLTTAVNLIKEEGKVIVTGNERMKVRPIRDLVDALTTTGCDIEYKEGKGCPPIEVKTTTSGWKGGNIVLAANVSSQYVSSILISASYAKEPVILKLDDKGQGVCSRPYIDITIDLLKKLGVEVTEKEANVFSIANKGFDNKAAWTVEGDASSASYPLALAAVTGGTVTVSNCGKQSLQGDANFCQLLEKMGCSVSQTDGTTTVTGPKDLKEGLNAIEGEVDMDSMTDLFMTLAAVAAVSNGTTRIVNVANQRVKECNRIEAMVLELTKCDVKCKELETGIEITGNPSLRERSSEKTVYIDPRDDHRLAMSFAVLGAAIPGIAVQEKSCVNKTYPTFWDHSKNLGLALEGPAQGSKKLKA
eukprot:CAMPEP_0184496476 /NCGR_PEP_ID=MMETSP0113_2-20130426/34037_1 /TAXON_ID=91329 /ORGANISM="Norrisiella sphaerica, Strain BC52" /LENGTH=472 /DNA_ID=CAMNT_0026883105 /DNA_START=90 /DNA_END=1508 /DNA_ORIENTATION=-